MESLPGDRGLRGARQAILTIRSSPRRRIRMVERSPAGTSRRVLIEPIEAGMGSDARSEA